MHKVAERAGRSTITENDGILPEISGLGKNPFINRTIDDSAHSGPQETAFRPRREEGLFRRGNSKREDNLGQAILVFGIGIFDVGFRFL